MKQSSPPAAKWLKWRLARRISQTLFLILFLVLIGITASITGGRFDAGSSSQVPYPVEAFLDADPFASLMVILSTFTLPKTMIYSLVVVISAILFGRLFCAWVCPMGTLNHLASEVAPSRRGKRRIIANRTRPYQKWKYGLLTLALASALFGSALGGILDPISIVTRGIALTVLPWLQWGLGGILDAATRTDTLSLQQLADRTYDILGGVILHQRGLIVGAGVASSIFFVAVLVANRFIPRFWCRGLCPLGALLGLIGRFGLLTLVKDKHACIKCGKCQLNCSGAASPHPEETWHRSECDLCLNCVASCPTNALAFKWASTANPEQASPDIGRRAILASAVAGVTLVPGLRTGVLNSPLGRPDPRCIRPPGAMDEPPFLSRCIRCGQCMKICPTNALHPAFDEAGVEGLFTPVLIPRIGYCEPTCTLCTQVCPTGAIRGISESQKLGNDSQKILKIGTAFIDRGRCLPWAMGTPCVVCEEFCPMATKAIWLSEETIKVRDRSITVKRPHVDPAACSGCGACEHACPVHDKAAIRVSAAGETRSAQNKLLLGRRNGNITAP